MTAIGHGITSDLGRKKPFAGDQDVAEDLMRAALGASLWADQRLWCPGGEPGW